MSSGLITLVLKSQHFDIAKKLCQVCSCTIVGNAMNVCVFCAAVWCLLARGILQVFYDTVSYFQIIINKIILQISHKTLLKNPLLRHKSSVVEKLVYFRVSPITKLCLKLCTISRPIDGRPRIDTTADMLDSYILITNMALMTGSQHYLHRLLVQTGRDTVITTVERP